MAKSVRHFPRLKRGANVCKWAISGDPLSGSALPVLNGRKQMESGRLVAKS
jgi:hypothetical protein